MVSRMQQAEVNVNETLKAVSFFSAFVHAMMSSAVHEE